jgi:hypothetical protein
MSDRLTGLHTKLVFTPSHVHLQQFWMRLVEMKLRASTTGSTGDAELTSLFSSKVTVKVGDKAQRVPFGNIVLAALLGGFRDGVKADGVLRAALNECRVDLNTAKTNLPIQLSNAREAQGALEIQILDFKAAYPDLWKSLKPFIELAGNCVKKGELKGQFKFSDLVKQMTRLLKAAQKLSLATDACEGTYAQYKQVRDKGTIMIRRQSGDNSMEVQDGWDSGIPVAPVPAPSPAPQPASTDWSTLADATGVQADVSSPRPDSLSEFDEAY